MSENEKSRNRDIKELATFSRVERKKLRTRLKQLISIIRW